MDTGVISVVIGLIGLAFALILYTFIKSKPGGTDLMKEISDVIHNGAMVFLKREYSILVLFIIVVFALLAWKIRLQTGYAFLGGAACSMLAGFFGMKAGFWAGSAGRMGQTPDEIEFGHNIRADARQGDDPVTADDHLGFRIAIHYVITE